MSKAILMNSFKYFNPRLNDGGILYQTPEKERREREWENGQEMEQANTTKSNPLSNWED